MGFKDLELGKSASKVTNLKAVEVGLTSRCNFNCNYCGAYNRKDKESRMSADRVIEIISELPHLERIRLSGGEVTLLFDDCLKIVKYCTSRGVDSQINTNGSILNTEQIDMLAKAGLKYMHFSLNHIDPKSHDIYYRMGEGTFRKIIDNIRHVAMKTSIDAITETIVFEETIDYFDEIYSFIHDLGVRKLQIQTPVKQKGWKSGVPKDKIAQLLEMILAMNQPDSEFYFTCFEIDRAGQFYKNNERLLLQKSVFFPNCVEGKSQLHLHGNGDIIICDIGKPVLLGNVNGGDSLRDTLSVKSEELKLHNSHCKCTTYL